MYNKLIRILLIEDSKLFSHHITKLLEKSKFYNFKIEHVNNLDDGFFAIETNNVDSIILDLNLPDSTGLLTLEKLYKKYNDIPIVVLTAIEDEDIAFKAIQKGANDYLIKNRFDDYLLERSLIYSIERKKTEIELRKRIEYEEALSTFSQALLSSYDKSEDLESALSFLLDASRSYRISIFKNYSKDKGLFTKRIVSFPRMNKEFFFELNDDFNDFRKNLSSGTFINNSPRSLNRNVKKVLFSNETKFTLIIPIWTEGIWYGFIIFESKSLQQKWDEESVRMLLTATEIISAHLLNKKASTELEKANKELKKLLEMKDDFLAIAGHDLRSPFFGILGFSELLINHEKISGDEELKSYVYQIQKSAQIQLDYVNDLLDILKLESGEMKLNLEKTNLSKIILSSMDNFKLLAEKKGINLDFPYGLENCSIEIEIDSVKFTQVVNNLLSNAIKFTHSGGKISIWCEKKKDKIVIFVKDTGLGIPEENINDIFNKYKQFHEKGTKGENGSGLGLAICKNIVELHGGNIYVNSKTKMGSEFYFTIPITRE